MYYEYSTKDLGQAASPGMDQSQARFNPNTWTKIEIGHLARAWVRARQNLPRVFK